MKHVLVVSEKPYRNVTLVKFMRDLGCSAEVRCSPVDDDFWSWLTARIERRQEHMPTIDAIVFWDENSLESIRQRGSILECVSCLTPEPVVIFLLLDEGVALFMVDAPLQMTIVHSYREFKKECQEIFGTLGLLQPK